MIIFSYLGGLYLKNIYLLFLPYGLTLKRNKIMDVLMVSLSFLLLV